jgi:beta-glucosidase
MVVSDYFAISQLVDYHQYAPDKATAARMTLDAGMDLELPSIDAFHQPLLDAVHSGSLPEQRIDESVRRVLAAKFAFGLFENPWVDPAAVAGALDTAEQRALARTLAERSLVLLKNDGTLPLARTVKSLAVIGPNADSARNMGGDYSYPAHIESLIAQAEGGFSQTPMPEHMETLADLTPTVTVLQGLRAALPKAKITYAQGCGVLDPATDGIAAAVKAAKVAGLAVLVVGDKAGLTLDCSVGEFRDSTTLGLPGVQEELVRAVLATGTPTVVVLVNGRPYSIGWLLEQANAVLEAWLPGEEGGSAVAAALLGDVNPGGKLPVTVVRSAGQVPLFYNHRPSGAKSFAHEAYVDESNTPLLPFGFGLSYTTFAIGNLALDKAEVRAGGRVRASVDVTNTGGRAGSEVVQLYTRTDGASVTRPVKELRGFRRVDLQPGETKTVVFDLSVAQMAYYDINMNLGVEPGRVTVMVGNSAHDVQASAAFEIAGPALRLRKRRVFFNQVSVK